MDWMAFKANRSKINQDAFAQALLRHMVQLQVGKELSDAEYSAAMQAAIKAHGGAVNLRNRSAGSISAIAGKISEAFQQIAAHEQAAGR